MEEAAQTWEARYQSGETGWDRGAASASLGHWLRAGALSPCQLLIPGCGRGHEVVELARQGFDITALDIAPSAIDHLRGILASENIKARVECANVLNWQPEAPFDAIYEQTCLCALPSTHWESYERQLYDWLRPGG